MFCICDKKYRMRRSACYVLNSLRLESNQFVYRFSNILEQMPSQRIICSFRPHWIKLFVTEMSHVRLLLTLNLFIFAFPSKIIPINVYANSPKQHIMHQVKTITSFQVHRIIFRHKIIITVSLFISKANIFLIQDLQNKQRSRRMKVCFDIDRNVAQEDEKGATEEKAILQSMIEPKRSIVRKRVYCWRKAEKKRYLTFLKESRHLFSLPRTERKVIKINVLMSRAIKSRTPAKCHSFHQKMIKKHGSIQGIISSGIEIDQPENMAENKSEDVEKDLEEDIEEGFSVNGGKNQPYWLQFADLMTVQKDWEENEPLSQ